MSFNHINQKSVYQHKYSRYFSMDYLLKFGYFDFKFSSRHYDEDYILSNMVYKRVLNTNELQINYAMIDGKVKFNSYTETAPIELSIYKNEDERRIYKLPNMYSYISLCKHLNHHKGIYLDIIEKSENSLSKFFHAPFFKGKQKREENRIGKKHIFKTDIQNFYPSIYTHSIPWILVGKSEAKKNKTKKSVYYNELDSLIQRCQRGETHGLPTGSFASKLIAEIYMCKFDGKMDKYSYLRYVDDFEFSYNDESNKGEFYKDLNIELNKLNLKIKIEKNQIDSFPFRGDNNSAFFFDYFSNIDNEKDQIKRIYNFVDSCIYKESEGYKGALKLMFKSLKSSINNGDLSQAAMTKHMLKQLFNLVLMKPDLAVFYLEFIEILDKNIINKLLKPGIREISMQICVNIDRYIDLNYSQELYSLLTIFIFLDYFSICSKDQLLNVISKMDDISSVLALELYLSDEGNIDEIFFETIEKKLENSIRWEDDYWLFKYQVLLRINEGKKNIIYKKYKKYIFFKYNNGIKESEFFNQKNIIHIESPINLAFQNKNSNSDIMTFFKELLKRKIRFVTEI